MPSYKEHIGQAEHNGELLRFIGSQNRQTEFSDWYVTIAFYTALHYFEAMVFAVNPTVVFGTLNAKIEHSGSLGTLYTERSGHQLRRKLMRMNFQDIYNPYSNLYEMSRIARYDCHTPRSYNWGDAEMYLDSVRQKCEGARRAKKG
jgi:hypothetical protein